MLALAEKVKIKLLRNIVLDGYKKAGEVELNDAIALRLINARIVAPIIEISQPNLFDEGDCG